MTADESRRRDALEATRRICRDQALVMRGDHLAIEWRSGPVTYLTYLWRNEPRREWSDAECEQIRAAHRARRGEQQNGATT